MNNRMQARFRSALLSLILLSSCVGSAHGDDPWEFLQDFKPLPNGVARIGERYIAAILHQQDENLLAVVVVSTDCDARGCRPRNMAAYWVFNQEGVKIREFVDPREEELIQIMTSGIPA